MPQHRTGQKQVFEKRLAKQGLERDETSVET